MDDVITFKAFLYMEEGAKAEVRRFNIDRMFYGKIRPLMSRVRDVFPKLKAKNFTLAWKDEDNDEVLISSDEEVETMHQQSRDSVLKLIVRYIGPKTDDDETAETYADAITARNDPQSIHHGVTCHGCGRAVVGFRYKCITCDDFDLCVLCENIGKHPEHCVVRVPRPNMSVNITVLAIAATSAEEAIALSAARASSPVRVMTLPRCNKEAPQQAKKLKETTLSVEPVTIDNQTFQPTLEECCISQDKPNAKQDATKGKQETPMKKKAQIEQPVATSKQDLVNVPPTSGATKVVLPTELTLQDISELIDAVAAAKAEISSNASTCSSSGSVKAEEWTVIDIPNDEAKKDLVTGQLDEAQNENKMNDQLKPEGVEETTRRIAPVYPPLNTATAVLDSKNVALAASAPEMPKQVKPIVNEEDMRRRKDVMIGEKRGKSEEMRNKTAEAQSTASIDHSTLAPHIQAAVTYMENMGFSDQSEWLTQLLIDVNGNISAVLDLITPHKPHPK